MTTNHPERDEADEKIERLRAELEEDVKSIFTDAPHPGPIPETLRKPPPPPPPPKTPGSDIAAMGRAWAIALDFVFTVLAGAGLGWLFDRWRSTGPVGLLVGLGLGFVVAFWRIIRTTQREEEAERRRRGRS